MVLVIEDLIWVTIKFSLTSLHESLVRAGSTTAAVRFQSIVLFNGDISKFKTCFFWLPPSQKTCFEASLKALGLFFHLGSLGASLLGAEKIFTH